MPKYLFMVLLCMQDSTFMIKPWAQVAPKFSELVTSKSISVDGNMES